MSLLDDVWRMTRRQEKAVYEMEKIQKIPSHDSKMLRAQIAEATARLSSLYGTIGELHEEGLRESVE